MAEMATHLIDHVFPRLPARQWALSVPKRLRYFEQHDRRAVTAALNPFLRLVAPSQHQWRLSVSSRRSGPTSRMSGSDSKRTSGFFTPTSACDSELTFTDS
jgi:hypothetical protein